MKYKHEIIIALFIVLFAIAFYFLYGLILPFIFGLALALASVPVINKIQKVVKKQNLAISAYLISIVIIIAGLIFLLASFINQDFKRLNNSFKILATENQDVLNETQQKIKETLSTFYDFDQLESELRLQADSLSGQLEKLGEMEIDTEAIGATFEKIASFFKGDEESKTKSRPSFSFMFIFFSTITYFILIIFNIDYFVSLRNRYFTGNIKSRSQVIVNDFNHSFIRYFKLRTRIVFILSILYIIAFLILNLPGMILLTLLIILLSYIPYLQYIALIPISIGCLVLSIEHDQSFFIYFGIMAGVFILASILEEVFLNPMIMEKHIGLDPAIMVLGVSIFSYLMGLPGLLLGIPFTVLILIYIKRYLLTALTETRNSK